MIIVELQGGLGNQMFQYACGKALSLKHNQKLLIDSSLLGPTKAETKDFMQRDYELAVFKLNAEVVGKQLLKSFEDSSFYKKTRKLLKLPYKKCYHEIPGEGASQLDKITSPVLLKGYWQSEQYFLDYKKEIRRDFAFQPDPIGEIEGALNQINKTNSVSVHFRRGDYLSNPVAKKVLGPLDIGYYAGAIKKIQNELGNPFFYIFSDDPEWVKKNLPLSKNYKIMEEFQYNKPHYDLLLMSNCKHHIIANSSFSWWGAWLNADPKKIVIAPNRWFADEQMNKNSTYLVPREWIKL
jgi:hypothetical protein